MAALYPQKAAISADGRRFGVGLLLRRSAAVAQLVERVLGKDEVMGPNPISSWNRTVG